MHEYKRNGSDEQVGRRAGLRVELFAARRVFAARLASLGFAISKARLGCMTCNGASIHDVYAVHKFVSNAITSPLIRLATLVTVEDWLACVVEQAGHSVVVPKKLEDEFNIIMSKRYMEHETSIASAVPSMATTQEPR